MKQLAVVRTTIVVWYLPSKLVRRRIQEKKRLVLSISRSVKKKILSDCCFATSFFKICVIVNRPTIEAKNFFSLKNMPSHSLWVKIRKCQLQWLCSEGPRVPFTLRDPGTAQRPGPRDPRAAKWPGPRDPKPMIRTQSL